MSGHKSPVLDLAWNPFNDNQIASASEDCTVLIWDIPEGGLKSNLTEYVIELKKHQRKVSTSPPLLPQNTLVVGVVCSVASFCF